MVRLKPCPFCGGEAAIGDVMTFRHEGKRIKCTKRYAGTMYVLIDAPKVNLLDNTVDESTRYTEEQAIQRAIELWERRAGNGNQTDSI